MKTIETLYNQWLALQPLKPADQKRLDKKFMLEFNYNSNHIEGNTLTYGQTELLLMFDETSGSASLKDYEEMKAHNVGLEMIKQYAKENERPLTESFIRELNHTILVRNYWKDAKTPEGKPTRMEVKVGEYKSRANSVVTATGEVFEYATPEETPALMTDLVTWFNKEIEKGILTPVEVASLFHYRYIRIHPFEDGNGRIARLLVNYILHKFEYPMIIIKSANKGDYLRILHQCDVNCGLRPNDGANATIDAIEPFVAYVKQQIEYALNMSISAAKGENIEEEDDFTKQLELIKRKATLKKIAEDAKIKFSKNEVWNVLEFCYFPIAEKLELAMKPASDLFHSSAVDNRIAKTPVKSGGLHLNYVLRTTTNSQILNYIENAKAMFYNYTLSGGSRTVFGDKDISIIIEFSVSFHSDYYILTIADREPKRFDYESYPSNSEVDTIINLFKSKVLDKISKSSI